MPSQRVLIYILRRDLRLADNPVFHEIHQLWQQSRRPFTHILPVYIFSAQQIEISGFLKDHSARSPYPQARSELGGFWRCGPHRAKFLAESVWDLKSELVNLGRNLVIRVGVIGDVVDDLLQQFKQHGDEASVYAVWMTEEEGVEEKREERSVRSAAEKAGVDFRPWLDEKYFIDEYACCRYASLLKLQTDH